MPTGAPASAWRCARRSWSTTGAGCGSTPSRARCRGPSSVGPCRSASPASGRGAARMTRPPTASPTATRWPEQCHRQRQRQRRGRAVTQFEGERQIEVLLVEDDPGDVMMTREAFQDYKLRNELHVVSDGAEAMAFLRQEGEYAGRPRPDLVLLDLNLPRMDGRQVLEAIKSDPELASIPVVVLTTSENEDDVLRSYSLHANAYVTKPVDFEQFIRVIRQIDDFFVSVVRLPRR